MMDNSINRERCDDHRQSLFQNGCGYSPMITITINPTTGGQFNLDMRKNDTIENLKRIVSKKLKVSRERICLLHRERQLKEGTLEENEVIDGSRLTLLPIVETGLAAQKPELSVMNALESLNEAQVNDFLSGKQPLNLTMRLGDHMMLIQLMLSTFSNQSHGSSSSSSSSSSSASSSRSKSAEEVSKSIPPAAATAAAAAATSVAAEEPATTLENEKSAESFLYTASASSSTTTTTSTSTSTSTSTRLEKILSSSSSSSSGISANCTSKSTNVRQKEIDRDDSQNGTRLGRATAAGVAATRTTENEALAASSSASRLTEKRTSEFRTYDECKRTRAAVRNRSDNADASCTCTSCPRVSSSPTTSTIFDTSTTAASCTLDSVALSEATRNLTQTLKKLSSEVLTSKRAISVPQKFKSLRSNVVHYKRKPNAIIENMNHHGRGIYSGTFSGTLNPALQDRHGRPKKDVSTIIHILNDLLCANPRPQCRKSSCASNNGGDSSSNGSNSSSSMVIESPSTSSSNTANDEHINSTAQVPAPSATASATPASNEIVDAVSKSNENQTTRNKMKQLKSIMEERKEKRKAKRFSPYERPFSCIDLISSPNLNSSGAWSSSSSDSATSIHPTKESIEPDPTPSIHSEPVIA